MLGYIVIAIGLIVCISIIIVLVRDLGGPCESTPPPELYKKG